MGHWDIEKINKTEDGTVISIVVVDKEYREAHVSFKWDGCVDYNKFSNGYTVDDEDSKSKAESADYIHICDIDDMIEKLQEIKKIAEENFDKQNFEMYWNK